MVPTLRIFLCNTRLKWRTEFMILYGKWPIFEHMVIAWHKNSVSIKFQPYKVLTTILLCFATTRAILIAPVEVLPESSFLCEFDGTNLQVSNFCVFFGLTWVCEAG